MTAEYHLVRLIVIWPKLFGSWLMMCSMSGSLSVIFTKDLSFKLNLGGHYLSWSFVKIHVIFLHLLDVLLTKNVSWTDCSDERFGSLRLEIDEHYRDGELPNPTLPIICSVDGSHSMLAMLMLSCNIYMSCILFLIDPSHPFNCSLHVKIKD